MKNFIIFFLFISLFSSCKIDQISDLQLDAYGPWSKNYQNKTEVYSKGNLKISEKYYKSFGWNFYFEGNTNEENYLFSSSIDATRKIKTVVFEQNNKAFAVLATGSKGLNWKSGNRLLLFKLVNMKPIEILDTAQEKYKNIYFEGEEFVYVSESGPDKRIKIN